MKRKEIVVKTKIITNWFKFMRTIYITIGIPGCGKSRFFERSLSDTSHNKTYFKRIPYVSSDAIREELFGNATYQSRADEVFAILKLRTERALSCGRSVYVDATNIRKDWRKWAIDLGKKYEANVCGIVFNVPYFVAVKRDRMRTRNVGWWVLFKYRFLKYQKPTFGEGFDNFIYVDKSGCIVKQTERN